jgi:phage shock protein PspC (stress-responsive transcriptional regulator)
MKKIININLSGRVIPIEDSAYEKLQAYIESLRKYFAREESRDEIINDIESRIAELMSEKVRKGASTITDADVDEIASSMGRPEDFDAVEPETIASAQEPYENKSASGSSAKEQTQPGTHARASRGRLYRDSSDKFVAGVCSGLAAYLNVDPAIVRILFAIITFGGFGIGILAYILLWIFLPTKDLEGFSGKRLYRNPDDKMFGGVAGGLAAYFNRSSNTIRLIFAAPILLSIVIGIIDRANAGHDFNFFPNLVSGSLSGAFFFAYVILWMLLPEANTAYEKMEMRGETVDVNRIRQNVKEGMGNMKDRMRSFGEEVKESAQNFSSKAKEFSNTRGREFAREVNERARSGGRGVGHAIGVLFKVFFLFILGVIAFSLFVTLIALIFGGIAWWPVNNFLWTSKWQLVFAWGTVIFFLLVPLVAILVWLIRRIIRTKSKSPYLGWTFGFLWTIGWVSAILLASSISRDFREYEHRDQVVNITQPANNKLILAVSEPALEYTGRFEWINDNNINVINEGGDGWDLSSDTLKLSTVRFNIRASADSAYHVVIRRYAYGRTREEATRRAERIQYAVALKDSVLDLGNGYAIDKDSKFRFQQVEIEVQVPIGKKIRFDHSVTTKLNPMNFRVERQYRRGSISRIRTDRRYAFLFITDKDYTMGLDGVLKDENGKQITDDDFNRMEENEFPEVNPPTDPQQYRYPGTTADSTALQIQRRRVEEENRKLEQLEQEHKNKTESKPVSQDNEEEEEKEQPLPIASVSNAGMFSLMGWFN